MTGIDSRIVTMKFDNAAFERNARTSMSTLQKLSTTLTGLPGASKGMAALQGVASKFTLGSMFDELGRVKAGFAALATVGITALANITNKAVDAGLQFAKSFTIQPLIDGFSEYELKIGSIQAILANTSGASLNDVNQALNQLNAYSDKTIYNFGEMVSNIKTFTVAGIDLKTSVASVKGLANVAALTGTNAQEAAQATYQMAQAMSSGSVRLQDWISMEHAGGMAGKVFQDSLIRTAKVHGVNVDDMIKKNGSFRLSLSEGWLTTEIMNETLGQFAGSFSRAQLEQKGYTEGQVDAIMKLQQEAQASAQDVKTFSALIGTIRETVGSGWATTFETIFGNLKESTVLWTNVNDAIGGMISKSSDARNKVLADWKEMGGRTNLIEGIAHAWNALGRVLTPIKNAFRDVFPPITGKILADITDKFAEFTEGLMISKGAMKDIRSIFDVIFGAVKLVLVVIGGVIKYFAELVGLVSRGSGGFLHLVGSIARVISAFQDWVLQGEFIQKFFDHVIAGREALFGPIIDAIGRMLGALGNFIDQGAAAFLAWLDRVQPQIQAAAAAVRDFISNGIDKLREGLSKLAPALEFLKQLGVLIAGMAAGGAAAAVSAISSAFGNLGKDIPKVMESIKNSLGGIGTDLDLGSLFDVGDAPQKAAAGIKNVSNSLGGFKGIATSVKNALGNMWDGIGNFMAPLGDALSGAFGWIKDQITGFVSGMGVEDALALVNTGFFIAFYNMARKFTGSLKGLADAGGKTIEKIGGTFDAVTGNLKAMQADVKANAILKIAAALAILAASIYVLSKIEPHDLGIALGAVAAVLGTLITAMKVLENGVGDKGALAVMVLATAMVAMSTAVLMLAGAVALLGSMDTSTLVKGLGSVAAILAIIIGATAVLSKVGGAGQLFIAAAAIGVLAFSLTLFAGALKLYSSLDWGMIADGGLKAAAAIVAIGVSMRAMPKDMLASAASLLIVSAALVVLGGALQIMASMSGGDSAQALIVLGGALLVIAIAMNQMTGALPGAAAMLIMAAALAVLAPVLAVFGAMSWENIAKAGVVLVGLFTILGLAGSILGPVVPVIGALAGAIALLGAGAFLAGAGVALLATGLGALAISGAAGFAVLIGGIHMFLGALPMMIRQFGMAIRALAIVIRTAGPPFVAAMGVILRALLKEITKSIPSFGRLMKQLIETGLKVIRATFPDFLRTGFQMLDTFLRAVKQRIPKIVPLAIDAVMKFLNAVGKKADQIADAGAKLIIKFMNGIAKAIDNHSGEMSTAAGNIGRAIVSGIVKAIGDGIGAVAEAARNLAANAISAAMDKLRSKSPSKEFIKIGGYVVDGFRIGLNNHSRSTAAAENLADNALQAFRVSMSKAGDTVSGMGDLNPVITPVLDLTQLQKDATQIGSLVGTQVAAGVSYDAASSISADVSASSDSSDASDGSGETKIEFNQYNTSPESLSAVEIYRNTRSQINLAKEALSVI